MAPEQIRGTPAVSHKTDLYALGVVLYQLLAGKPPFEGSTPVVLMHSHLNEPPPRPSAKIHEIPKVLDELVVTLMAKAPADRPWDAAAVGMKLTELRDKASRGEPVAMVWPSSQGRAPRIRACAAPKRLPRPPATMPTSGDDRRRKKTRKSRTLASRDGPHGSAEGSLWLSRSTLETALLVSACVAIGGFIAYWVWPPSAALPVPSGRDADGLVSRRADWTTARDEYMKELDDRFPDHPYQRTNPRMARSRSCSKTPRAGPRSCQRPEHHHDQAGKRRRAQVRGRTTQLADRGIRTRRRPGRPFGNGRRWRISSRKPRKRMIPTSGNGILLALRRVEQLENAIKDRREIVEKQLAARRSARLARAVPTRRSRSRASWSNSSASTPTSPTSSVAPRPSADRTQTPRRRPLPAPPTRTGSVRPVAVRHAEGQPARATGQRTAAAEPPREGPPPTSRRRLRRPRTRRRNPERLAERDSQPLRAG